MMNRKFRTLTSLVLLVTGFAGIFTSCGDKDDPKPTMVATSIELVSGGSQTAEVGSALTNNIVILVKDQEGNAFEGATVNFTVTEGSVSVASTTSDASGNASVTWTLGATEGTQTLSVAGAGTPLSVTATAALAAPVATSIELVSGGDQTADVETTLANDVVVIVKDQYGDAFAGTTVNFTVTEGSVSVASAVSDASGNASVTWTLGATEGTQTLSVAGAGTPISVTATAALAAPVATSIELVTGGEQTAMTEAALENDIVVIVKDQYGDAFAGTTVNFAVTEGSVSVASAVSDDNGNASLTWTLGTTEGTQTLTVSGVGTDLEVTATATYRPVIGDFKFGGVIFYIDETGAHGLVCAVTDQSTGAWWGCQGTTITGADGTAVGTGAQNTIDIVAGCATEGTAADICSTLTLNTYENWFLPSKDELNLMYQNKTIIDATAIANDGNVFANEIYWSSTKGSINMTANTQSFTDGSQVSTLRNTSINVRATLAF